MIAPPLYVGIDMAKATLDIAVRPTAETWCVANEATSIDTLVTRLGTLPLTLIVVEATGGYQGPLVAALVAAALPVVVVNPRHVRAFAQAVGSLAKTDRMDARVIAHFAEAVKPAPRPLPDTETQELRALLVRRRQLVETVSAERARLDTAPLGIQEAIQAHIAWLTTQVAGLDDTLTQVSQRHPAWQAKDDVLQSIPGVGPVLARTMLGQVPEWGTLGPSRSWPCSASPPSTGTVGRCADGGASTAVAPPCEPCCIGVRSSPRATIPSSKPFTSACWPRAKRRRWP